MSAIDLSGIIILSIAAMFTVVAIILALRMVKEAKAVKSGDLVELAKLAKLAESAQSSNAPSWFGSTLIGLIPFSIGIFIAALTIHLYVNGIETIGTIKNRYGSSVNRYGLGS